MPEPAQAANMVTVAKVESPAVRLGGEDVSALLKLCKSQLAEVRRLLDEGSMNPKTTGQELFDVHRRLDEIEARMLTAAAVVMVSFPTGGTAFRPSPEVAEAHDGEKA
jgi:uncharacterized protein YqiB (DUF1249 family)